MVVACLRIEVMPEGADRRVPPCDRTRLRQNQTEQGTTDIDMTQTGSDIAIDSSCGTSTPGLANGSTATAYYQCIVSGVWVLGVHVRT